MDTAKQALCYAGAGHPPLILWDNAAGETRELMENGLFLGYFPDAAYTSVEIPFRKATGECSTLTESSERRTWRKNNLEQAASSSICRSHHDLPSGPVR